MKKIKKLLKIIVCVLVMYLLCFAGVIGYKVSQYQKVAKARVQIFDAESLKITVKDYPVTEDASFNIRTAMRKDEKSVIKYETTYSEEAKARHSEYKDNSGAMYYTQNKYEEGSYQNNLLFINFNEKTFGIFESAVYGKRYGRSYVSTSSRYTLLKK